tara:strand:- start:49 stop:1791 length:1743 start_codon:yes stop_codon:yes gene_type:complete
MAELVLPSGAIKVIQSQQQMVGGAIAGGAGSVSSSMSGDTIQVLEDIKELSLKQFKGLNKVAKLLADTLNFDKAEARRKKDQSTELSKENQNKTASGGNSTTAPGNIEEDEGGFEIGAGGGFLAGMGIQPLMKKAKGILGKIVKPFSVLLGSLGRLTGLAGLFTRLAPLLVPLGPVGAIVGALFLIVQYSDELAKALAPLIDGLKKTFEILKPVTDIVFGLLDMVIKTGLATIGGALGVAVAGLNNVLGGLLASVIFIKDLVVGLITGDMNLIANAWKTVKATFAKLGDSFINAIKSLYNGIIDSLPLPDKLKSKLKLETKEIEEPKSSTVPTGKEDLPAIPAPSIPDTDTSSNAASTIEEPKVETVVIEPKAKPKTINMDKTSGVTQVAEKISGDPNLPPLGINMYKTTGDTYDERAKQWYEFKDALVQAEKDGSITKDEIEFRIMQLKGERNSLKSAKQILSIGKQRADLKGETFDEASKLKELDSERSETQSKTLAAEGMTVASYDEAVNNKLQPNVNKRDLKGDGAGSQGNVTVVNNQPSSINTSTNVAKTSVTSVPLNTSSGDSYFDKQANNIHV